MISLLPNNRIVATPCQADFTKRILVLSFVVTMAFIFIVGPSVQTANANYAFFKKWGGFGTGNGQFSGIFDTVADHSKLIYTVENVNNRVQKFLMANHCPTGTTQVVAGVCFVTKWGGLGSGNGQFNQSTGLGIDSSGNIYVTEVNNHRVQMFKGDSSFIRVWGTQGSGDGQFKSPFDVAVDSTGSVYVADTGNNRIQKFQFANPCPAGTTQVVAGVCFVTKWGTQGTGDGQFQTPHTIAVDRQGNVYVGEWSSERIQKFKLANPCPAGTTQVVAGVCFVTKWGTPGTGDGQFKGILGVAVDKQGNAYTSERGNFRVQKFQFANPCPAGTTQVVAGVCFVTKWGTQGIGDGQFLGPNRLYVDSSGKVYVTDIGSTIQAFTP
jgi:tripartite motif-containing protein 71